jgi:hypothetical protein
LTDRRGFLGALAAAVGLGAVAKHLDPLAGLTTTLRCPYPPLKAFVYSSDNTHVLTEELMIRAFNASAGWRRPLTSRTIKA